jgi:hypothetical protein
MQGQISAAEWRLAIPMRPIWIPAFAAAILSSTSSSAEAQEHTWFVVSTNNKYNYSNHHETRNKAQIAAYLLMILVMAERGDSNPRYRFGPVQRFSKFPVSQPGVRNKRFMLG